MICLIVELPQHQPFDSHGHGINCNRFSGGGLNAQTKIYIWVQNTPVYVSLDPHIGNDPSQR